MIFAKPDKDNRGLYETTLDYFYSIDRSDYFISRYSKASLSLYLRFSPPIPQMKV